MRLDWIGLDWSVHITNDYIGLPYLAASLQNLLGTHSFVRGYTNSRSEKYVGCCSCTTQLIFVSYTAGKVRFLIRCKQGQCRYCHYDKISKYKCWNWQPSKVSY